MEGFSRKEDGCHGFLDLNSREREWGVRSSEEERVNYSEEIKKLELRLGPPGDQDWTTKNSLRHESFLLGQFSDNLSPQNPVLKSPWKQQTDSQFLHLQPPQPQHYCSSIRELKNSEKKTLSPAPANTAVPNSQKRTAPGPVVGWPPIRSFRKNLAGGSSSKLASVSDDVINDKGSDSKPNENRPKNLFVKINMDGVPIGRKVDLKAYDSYEKLSLAVDELFRGLLAAQTNPCDTGGGKAIGGLLDGNQEYTLVYEDNEGDRMLVGDVPWHMFVSTVKRLRVLKSSDLPTLSRGSKQRKQLPFGTKS